MAKGAMRANSGEFANFWRRKLMGGISGSATLAAAAPGVNSFGQTQHVGLAAAGEGGARPGDAHEAQVAKFVSEESYPATDQGRRPARIEDDRLQFERRRSRRSRDGHGGRRAGCFLRRGVGSQSA